MTLGLKITLREFWKQKGQLWLYVVSLMFSLGVFLALDSVQNNVEQYIDQEKQSLLGGDLEVRSNQPFPETIKAELEQISDRYETVQTYEFSSMARGNEEVLLSQIKVVTPAYPLYGSVELESGANLSEKLQPGKTVVASALMTRLNIKIGETLKLGEKELTITDVIVSEPDQSLGLFDFGPRILVHSADLEALDLVGDKSRVSYKFLAKIPNIEEQNKILEILKPKKTEGIQIESIQDAQNSLALFSNRFLVFLKLVIFSLLILNGVGIVTILKAFLNGQRIIIATRKSFGEKPRQILFSYLATFSFWTFISLLGAILLASGMIWGSQSILAPILPEGVDLKISAISTLKSIILGMGTSLLFATFVIQQTTSIKPASLFRSEDSTEKKNYKNFIWFAFALGVYAVFIFLELENALQSSLFLGGIIVLFLIFWLLAYGVLWGLKKIDQRFNHLPKLTIRSLCRPGSSIRLFLGVFSLSLTLLFSLIVIEYEIQSNFVLSYPKDAPNVFLLDIKKEQIDDIQSFFPQELDFYPVIRAPITNINGKTSEQIRAENQNEEWSLRRPYNLTYYDQILSTERIIQSVERNQLFPTTKNGEEMYVSALDTIAKELDIKLSDTVVFNVQGRELTTKISSIRSRKDASSPTPFFFFVFETKDLEAAPQTLFATTQVEPETIGILQKEISNNFPQVSVLDTSEIGKKVGDIINQLSGITRFFTFFNLFIGFIIFMASLIATSEDRKKEAVFYRLQGMELSSVWKVVLYELLFISLFTIFTALSFAMIAGQSVLHFLFELSLSGIPLSLGIYAIVMTGFFLLVGSLILYKPLKTKPITFIREHTQE